MTYEESILKNITTSSSTRPGIAQISIRNPIDADIFVNLIEILPDAEFSTKGKLLITVNGVAVLHDTSDSFRNYAKYPLSLGKQLKRGQRIEITAWNGTDTNQIKCDFNIHLGMELKIIPSVAIPINLKDYLDSVSEFENIFPSVLRSVGTIETKLINMKGYKKLVLMLSAAAYSSGATVLIGGANITDGNLDTYGGVVTATNTTPAVAGVIDFGSIASRIPAGRGKRITVNGGNNYNWELQVSNDNIVWITVSSADSGSTNTVVDLQGAAQSFRYLRIILAHSGGTADNAQGQCGELYDANLFGGQSQVSFEVFDKNQWLVLIPASDIGAISQGQAVVITIGDVINDVGAKKFNYALPATQTDFRMKLSIINGGIQNSVSVLRVS
jgi:hypothetical protein